LRPLHEKVSDRLISACTDSNRQVQHKHEALEVALDRTLQLRAEPKRRPSPEKLEEHVLLFLNALLKALWEKKQND
jgi:hypothetical protein